MTAIDTSVLVAAFATWHEMHDVAVAACRTRPVLPAHAFVEAYSVLTRMPEPFRAASQIVAHYLKQRWSKHLIVPSAGLIAQLPTVLNSSGLSGGAAYDGLIALTAHEVGRPLVTLDRRAQRTYARLGVPHRLLTP